MMQGPSDWRDGEHVSTPSPESFSPKQKHPEICRTIEHHQEVAEIDEQRCNVAAHKNFVPDHLKGHILCNLSIFFWHSRHRRHLIFFFAKSHRSVVKRILLCPFLSGWSKKTYMFNDIGHGRKDVWDEELYNHQNEHHICLMFFPKRRTWGPLHFNRWTRT